MEDKDINYVLSASSNQEEDTNLSLTDFSFYSSNSGICPAGAPQFVGVPRDSEPRKPVHIVTKEFFVVGSGQRLEAAFEDAYQEADEICLAVEGEPALPDFGFSVESEGKFHAIICCGISNKL